MSVAWVGAGIAAVGVASSASSASKAGKAQQAGAEASIASQEYMYDQTRSDNARARASGDAAGNRLDFLLGIGGSKNPTAGNTSSLANAELVSSGAGGPTYNAQLYNNNDAYRKAWDALAQEHYGAFGKNYNNTSDTNWIEQGLRKALEADINAEKAAQVDNTLDPEYGSLLSKFTQKDLDNDQIYQNTHQYAQDQGQQAVNRLAAASGSLLSGSAIKAAQRSGANIANSFGNDAFNRFNTENTNIYNRLAGVSGAGQAATNQVNAAGQNYANNVSSTQIGLGNARGASAIAQGNALTNGLGQAVNGFQQQNYLNSLNSNAGFDSSNGYNAQMAYMNGQS